MLKLKELEEQFRKALTNARDICDLVEKENDREFTVEERAKLEGYMKEAQEVKVKMKSLQGDESMRKQVMDLGAGYDLAGLNGGHAGRVPLVKGMNLGRQFVDSSQWQAWFKAHSVDGRIPDTLKGINTPPVHLKSFGLFRQKDVITGLGSDSAGAFVDTDRTGIYEPLGRYQLTVRDLVDVRQTTSDTVEFVRQLTQSNAAAPVPESNVTTYSGATGEVSGQKPESSMTWEKVTETVKTIAVWVPATKRAISDAAQLRGLIDQELRADLDEELEDQMLNGSGTGEDLHGLTNTAGTLAQGWHTDLITTTRKAITNLLVNGKQRPTAWLLHPEDWEAIELLKDSENRYYWGGPMVRGAMTLWGVPVVQSFFLSQGTAWLGNWSKAVLWDREQASISVSDSHADFFIRNMVAILAEMRAAFGVIRPSAFVEVDLESS
jgi:HK97 family phage major capsid protein